MLPRSQSSSTLSTDLDTVQTPSTEGRNHADLHVDYLKKISENLISLNVKVEELGKIFRNGKTKKPQQTALMLKTLAQRLTN